MWLINTSTLQLEEFLTAESVEYAILSHRWGPEEITFADMENLKKARGKKGYAKVQMFCKMAASKGYTYAWMDTCCIDKKSSAELSEAINSMFQWYSQAAVCYVYLVDVYLEDWKIAFGRSEWFKRGWTLQELLAPQNVRFFDKRWKHLGDKTYLVDLIHEATGIHREAIEGRENLSRFNIAQKMSWASSRSTTRPEDAAYSLLGLFGVNMPLLYGEGEKAFIRLQEHILKDSDDHSIFTWRWHPANPQYLGLLAPSLKCFQDISKIDYCGKPSRSTLLRTEHSITNLGISIEARLWPLSKDFYIASIFTDVRFGGVPDDFFVLLFQINDSGPFQYLRVDEWNLPASVDLGNAKRFSLKGNFALWPSVTRLIMVRYPSQNIIISNLFYLNKEQKEAFRLDCFKNERGRWPETNDVDFGISEVVHNALWDPKECLLEMKRHQFGTAGKLQFRQLREVHAGNCFESMLLGFDFDKLPVCILYGRRKPTDQHIELLPHDVDDDNVTNKPIDFITCFETAGWSEKTGRKGIHAKPVKGHSNVWALKASSRRLGITHIIDGQWLLHVIMKDFDGYSAWDVQLTNL